ncbi:unnamed protein product [Durusdinium trenchii]|uniref:Integrase catalytic domain-containing protein n=1 Tax=Durusdinium trenchii TaxID=1381693 RepID=A0ABP0J0M2_9DINO
MEDPDTGEKIIRVEANPFAGLEKLMSALEATVGKSALDRKGELRAQYYQEIKRHPGERISAFCTRYRTLAAELKREGIHLHEEELGWMLKERLGLDPIRKQLLETALAGKEAYDLVETECLRLFRDLHTADPLHKSRQPEKAPLLQRFLQSQTGPASSYRSSSTSASSMTPSSVRSFRTQSSYGGNKPPFRKFGNNQGQPPQRQAYVAEMPNEEEALVAEVDEEEELVPDDDGRGPTSIEEVLQAEAEQLASELQDLEDQGCDPQMLDELEAGMEQAAESLVTMREARTKIQEVKKDRGYGKAGSMTMKSKPHGNQVPKQKANTRCFDCGEPGHWAGDAGCTKPGMGPGKPKGKAKGNPPSIKQVRVAETLNTEHLPPEDDAHEGGNANEVMMATHDSLFAHSLQEALKSEHTPTLATDKRFVGALDSACNRTCAGNVWLSFYLQALEKASKAVRQLIQTVEEDELFRFGNGGTQRSTIRYRLPMMVGSSMVLVWVSIVPVASLGLLLGRDFLSGIGAVLSFGRRKLRADLVNGEMIDLGQLTAGHFCLSLQPATWPCPGPQRWRKMGQDGVIELQLNSMDWWSKQLRFRLSHFDGFHAAVAPHEHLMTEHGIKAAMTAGAQAMQPDTKPPMQAPEIHDLTVGEYGSQVLRWRRLILRLRAKAQWHAHGQLLWLFPRPYLRYAPLPYPSISHTQQWEQQSVSMWRQKPRALPQQHHQRAIHFKAFTTQNLHELSQFRNRLGLEFAFMEDHLLQGMMAARSVKGMNQQLKREAIKEAQAEAAEVTKKGEQLEAVRSLIGPRGGLPSLKADLVKLAALFNIPVEAKMTNDELKNLCRPMVNELTVKSPSKPKPSTSLSSTDQRTSAKAPSPTGAYQSQGTPMPTKPSEPSLTAAEVQQLLAQQEQRFLPAHDDSWSSWPTAERSDPGYSHDPERTRRTTRLVPGRDPRDEPGLLPARRGMASGKWDPSTGSVKPELASNPWRIHQDVKPGQAQLIAQAWKRHERDRKLVSLGYKEVNEIFQEEWNHDLEKYQQEVFATSLVLDFSNKLSEANEVQSNDVKTVNDQAQSVMPKALVSEVYTTTERVAKSARKRGHKVGSSLSLESGWDFTRLLDRRAARKLIAEEMPYFLILAFPCTFWSILLNLNPPKDYEKRLKEATTLLRFAVQLAKDQRGRGHHFVLENPQSSRAWTLKEMVRALEDLQARTVDFHQCRFKLTDVHGQPHRKATRIATSSDYVIAELDGKPHSTLAIEGENLENEEEAPMDLQPDSDDSGSEPGGEVQFEEPHKISQGVKQALRRLHENTGHRSPKRLARALQVAGAPPQMVHAARHFHCAVCNEQKAPKARRPASLPSPKDTGDQVHLDIFELFDIEERRFYVIHAIDATSRFQMAEALEHKSSENVERFMAQKWLPILGPPRVIVADQGKEFVSHAFESFCSKRSIYLHHTAIQAPWQNGICERGGAVLKALARSIIKAHSVLGKEEMETALQEAVMSYNADVTDAGVSPCQAAFGRQPRMHGDCLGDFGRRLAEHSLISSSPSLARQVAMRETARLAMLRLHFSRGLRKAEVARSRSSTVTSMQGLEPGSIVYFYRQSKYNNKTAASKKKLSRWHGPALLVALEPNNGYVSYRGQLSKCALEHLRPASTLEQVASSVWEDAIQEVVDAACHDQEMVKPQPKIEPPKAAPASALEEYEPTEPPEDREREAEPEDNPLDLPPVHPQEMVRALEPRPESSQPAWSRMTSSLPESTVAQSPFPEAVRQAWAQRMPRQTSLDTATGSVKRPADAAPADVEGAAKRIAHEEPPASTPTPTEPRPSSMAHDALVMSHEVMEAMAYAEVHPLRQIQAQAILDHHNPMEAKVPDHGTWRGNWPMPSRTEFKRRQELRQLWPLGNEDASREVLAVLTARKERPWTSMTEDEKGEFRKAAAKGWSVWTDNDAVEILPDEEAARIRTRLKAEGQSHRILVPRFVYVDKNDGLRTQQNQLPLLANARLVVPGYADVEAYGIRCDAPTASRTSQHLLLTFAASMKWSLWSADIKSAFMKGEEFGPNERVLYLANIRAKAKDEPLLPFAPNGLCRVRKGVFGLADSPRRWYKRLNKAVTKRGWRISTLDNALWFQKETYPYRTSFGRFENVLGLHWRKLEATEDLRELPNVRKPLMKEAHTLVTFFHRGPSVQQKEENELKKLAFCTDGLVR